MSVWWSLVAWSLQATGWPREPVPKPISEVFVDTELLTRWVLPSQLVALTVTGRPAFRRIEVHGALHVMERGLDQPDGVPQDASEDEERFNSRFVRRPMRSRLGNTVEPVTLIRRFGADALRLGYLLSLHPKSKELATASESQLRRARRAVTRLSGKVTGLFHMTRDLETVPRVGEQAEARLADEWILARATLSKEAALKAYSEDRLAEVGLLLSKVIDDFGRYAAVAAGRPLETHGMIRPTTAAVIACLHEGFGPVCPYLFERLADWTRARTQMRADTAACWLVDLVEHLHFKRHKSATISSYEPDVFELLDRDLEELSKLVRVPRMDLKVSRKPEKGKTRVVGPCIVVYPDPAGLPDENTVPQVLR